MTLTIDEILSRSVTNIIPSSSLLKTALNSQKPLNVYMGIDPTATRIHIGHAVLLRKLQAFVELGHKVTFLIGDFTALIGDTSDKDTERPILTYKEIQENFKTYKAQAEKIIDFSKVTVVHNSTWLKELTFEDVVKLCQHFSVGDFTSRTLIKTRLDAGKRVGLHETLYPVMQGFDSYHLDTDIQMGGADQTFNMQAGRTLQKLKRNKESFVLVTQYLEGTDGRKMSKSWGNAIWLTDTPDTMFGKVMSLKDELLESYLVNGTALSQIEIDAILKLAQTEPMSAKIKLAIQIVKEFHSEELAVGAHQHFQKTFQDKEPQYDQVVDFKDTLLGIVASQVGSNSEAKRLIAAGSAKVNNKTISDPKAQIVHGDHIKIGKKIFLTVS